MSQTVIAGTIRNPSRQITDGNYRGWMPGQARHDELFFDQAFAFLEKLYWA